MERIKNFIQIIFKEDNNKKQKLVHNNDIAIINTRDGIIKLIFFEDKAPNHVNNFKKLAKQKFYDNTTFHRVVPNFMIQGGDPNSKDDNYDNNGQGGPGYSINAEFNDTPHKRGILSMARSQDPNSAGSQFFIVVKDSPHLDGDYTVFGKVISGMDVVDKIVNYDKDSNDHPFKRIEMTVEIISNEEYK